MNSYSNYATNNHLHALDTILDNWEFRILSWWPIMHFADHKLCPRLSLNRSCYKFYNGRVILIYILEYCLLYKRHKKDSNFWQLILTLYRRHSNIMICLIIMNMFWFSVLMLIYYLTYHITGNFDIKSKIQLVPQVSTLDVACQAHHVVKKQKIFVKFLNGKIKCIDNVPYIFLIHCNFLSICYIVNQGFT